MSAIIRSMSRIMCSVFFESVSALGGADCDAGGFSPTASSPFSPVSPNPTNPPSSLAISASSGSNACVIADAVWSASRVMSAPPKSCSRSKYFGKKGVLLVSIPLVERVSPEFRVTACFHRSKCALAVGLRFGSRCIMDITSARAF